MADQLGAVTSVWNLLWVLLVFGIAPRLSLRLIVRAYRRDNPRRAELIAELNAVPHIKRPLWVVEQLEVALFDGLAPRVWVGIRHLRRARRLFVRGRWVTIEGHAVYIEAHRWWRRRRRDRAK